MRAFREPRGRTIGGTEGGFHAVVCVNPPNLYFRRRCIRHVYGEAMQVGCRVCLETDRRSKYADVADRN